MCAIVADNSGRPTMRPTHATRALAACLALALANTGCYALAREKYTALRSPGVESWYGHPTVPVSEERTGHALSADPSAVHVARGAGSRVSVAVCDWDAGLWLIVFPPIPIPLINFEPPPWEPGTVAVRVTIEGAGAWRASFDQLPLLGPNGVRALPVRYRVVIADKAQSLAELRETPPGLEPCDRHVEPRQDVASARVALLGAGELWLVYDTTGWPKGPRALQLAGLSLDDAPLGLPELQLSPARRWFLYRFFP
jgi:hypothetical protein